MNPVLDQDRAQFIETKVTGAPKQLLPQWVRPEKELPVVSVPIGWVRFSVLNHRTRAEQKRVTRQPGKENVFADAMSEEAQKEQRKILSGQEKFSELLDDLRTRGQQEPAVITADGVLINGNRRSAALRQLFEDDGLPSARYVKAFVLPNDAEVDELVDLESELQVSKDFREEYSWVNQALLIEELFQASGKDWDKVAKRVRLKTNEAKEQYAKLQLLHQLVDMSDDKLFHDDFKSKETPFTELTAYIGNKGPAETRSVRDVFLLGTLADANYRKLRHLRRPDASEFVKNEFENEPTLSSLLKVVENDNIDGDGMDAHDILDDILGDESAGSSGELGPVLSFLAQRDPGDVIPLPSGETIAVADLLETVKSAVHAAANEADEESKDAQAALAPVSRLTIAIQNVKRTKSVLPKARTFPDFDEDDFREKIGVLKAEITKLESA